MFSNEKTRAGATVRKASAKDAAVTILTSGCHFTGKLYCRGSSRIGGKIEGEIISEGLLIIEEGAFIAANITAEEVIVQGTVKGKLKVKNRVEFAASCRFEGDLITPSLIVNEGAQFNGRSQMLAGKETMTGSGKILEPVAGFGGTKLPDLKIDGNDIHASEPEVAVMKFTEQPT